MISRSRLRLITVRLRVGATPVFAALFIGSVAICSAAQITSSLLVRADLGYPGSYQIAADNQPTSFDAANLPRGLSLNPNTGLITGAPSLSGDFPAKLTAHSQTGDAMATCVFEVYTDIPTPDPALAGLYLNSNRLLADPHRSRVYCGTYDHGLAVIDTVSMTVLRTFPSGTIVDLAISNDGRTLWVTRSTLNSLASVDLDLLENLVDLPVSEPLASVRVGSQNRLYGAARNGDVLQIDASTGVIQQRFTPSPGFRHMSNSTLAVSPDGSTLFVADLFLVGDSLVNHTACSRYSVSGTSPIFLQRVELDAHGVGSLVVTPDGGSVYIGLNTFDLYGTPTTHRTLAIFAGDLSQTQGVFSYPGTAGGPITISADGRQAVQPVARLSEDSHTMSALACIFDPKTFQLRDIIATGSNTSAGFGQVFITDAVFDQSGRRIVVATSLDVPVRFYAVPPRQPASPPPSKRLLNISTRVITRTGDNVVIGGFIVTGQSAKRVIVRAVGPSLPVPEPLLDPVLELRGPDGALIAENNDWAPRALDVFATHLPLPRDEESAIIATLPPGAYTAIVRGVGDTTGVSLVEVYDLERESGAELGNISTRGRVETGDNVMIGGFIIGGDEPTTIGIRALGPSLARAGVSDALEDPILELHDGNGTLQAQNDDWRNGDFQQLIASGLIPLDEREAALPVSLAPGNYTVIIRGKDDMVGVALFEVYNLH
ncbi:MAG: YncE family protein [Chthoniobacterales bacterium]